MRIALCNEVIVPMPFPKQCEYAAKLGYDGLEIAPYTLAEDPSHMSPALVAASRRAAEDAGIAVTGLHWLLVKPAGLSISTKDDAVRKKTLDLMFALVDLCAALGGRYLVHGSPGPAAHRSGRNARGGPREGASLLGRGGRARAKGRRRVLRRAAFVRADAVGEYAGGGREGSSRPSAILR